MSRSARAWVDGASRGNPGDSGFGVLFETDSDRQEIVGYLGRTTNNVAEYSGLIAALTQANRLGVEELVIRSDSELLVKQLNGAYQVKAPHLKPFFLRASELRRALRRCVIQHVRRAENADADRLANLAIDTRAVPPDWLSLPRT